MDIYSGGRGSSTISGSLSASGRLDGDKEDMADTRAPTCSGAELLIGGPFFFLVYIYIYSGSGDGLWQ